MEIISGCQVQIWPQRGEGGTLACDLLEMGSAAKCFVYCTVQEEPETRSVTQEVSGTTPPRK